MFAEANTAQKYIIEKFGTTPQPGEYAVPYATSRGDAFMKVVLTDRLSMHDFTLWWDDKFTINWYKQNPDGSPYVKITQFQGEDRRDAIVNHYGLDMVEEESFFEALEQMGYSENSTDNEIESAHVIWKHNQ